MTTLRRHIQSKIEGLQVQVGVLTETGMGGLQDSNAGPFKSFRIAICANPGGRPEERHCLENA